MLQTAPAGNPQGGSPQDDPSLDEVVQSCRELALKAYMDNDPETAESLLSVLAGILPDDPGPAVLAACRAAHRQSLDGRHLQALATLQDAGALDPGSEMIRFSQVRTTLFAAERLVRDGNLPAGLPYLDATLALAPDLDTARSVAINSLVLEAIRALGAGEIDGAAATFDRVLTLTTAPLPALKAVNDLFAVAFRPENLLQIRYALLSLLFHLRRDPDALRKVRMASGALRGLAGRCKAAGARDLEQATLSLTILGLGPDAEAEARLAAMADRFADTRARLRKELFLLDRNSICYSPFIGHTGRPNGRFGVTAEVLDADGFPNPARPGLPKAEARRVFVIGDSTHFISDGSMATTVPGRMQALLNAAGRTDTKVYNYAISGLTFHQPLALAQNLLLDLAPDLLVINLGGVDAVTHRNFDPRPAYPLWGFLFELAQEHFRATSAEADYQAIDPWDQLTTRVLDLQHTAGNDLSDTFYASVAEEFRLALTRLARFADAYDLPVIVTLEPMLTTRANPPPEEQALLSRRTRDQLERQYALFKDVAFPNGERVNPWSRRLQVVDITDVFDVHDGPLFTDWVHYGAEGRRLMAERLLTLIG